MDFLGRGWSFPPSFSRGTNNVQMVSDVEEITQSLHILFSTALGERIMRPKYGCNLHDYIFEPMDASLTAYIKDLIHTAVLYHEPRINLNDVTLSASSDEGRMEIMVDFTIRKTNSRYNQVFPFYRDEGAM